ncbi:MAG: TonB-dependent receptor, partial [Opitutaceae bacterium]|nr:TonB-dependent receptor [Opitutaceae bacterium]
EHPSWTIPIKSAPVVLIDAIFGYATKVSDHPVNVRVNIRNLADKHYLNGTFQYGEPRTFAASVGLRF